MHECDVCGKVCANAGALRMHRESHAEPVACPECGKEVKNLAAHSRKAHGASSSSSADGDAADPSTQPPGGEPPAGAFEERRPDTGTSSSSSSRRGGRLREWLGRDRGAPPAPATNERRPRTSGKRASTAPIMSMAWGGVGTMLERTGADVPVGRVMQFQSMAAGGVLDGLIAKTWVDRVLQPLAAKSSALESAGALFALPIMVAIMERSDEAFVSLQPMIRSVIAANLATMGPALAEREREAQTVAQVAADLGIAGDDENDALDVILAAIFAPAPGTDPTAAGDEGLEYAYVDNGTGADADEHAPA